MKRIYLFLGIFTILTLAGHAQTGHNQVSIGPEADIPVGTFGNAYKTGFGGTIKGLYGVGKTGQVTLTTGYSSFSGKDIYSGQTFGILPILLGYRANLTGLYIEPFLGMARYATKAGTYTFNETRFTYGGGIGFAMKALDLGARLQSHQGATLVAIRLAYAFNLAK